MGTPVAFPSANPSGQPIGQPQRPVAPGCPRAATRMRLPGVPRPSLWSRRCCIKAASVPFWACVLLVWRLR